MNNEKTNEAIIKKVFKKMGHIKDQLYEIEPAKYEI